MNVHQVNFSVITHVRARFDWPCMGRYRISVYQSGAFALHARHFCFAKHQRHKPTQRTLILTSILYGSET